MKKLNKVVWLCLSLIFVMGILAFAGISQVSAEKIVVGIWDNNQKPGLEQIMNDWAKKTGNEFEIQVTNWFEYWTLLEAGATGGSLPDVFWMHSNVAQKYMENGILLDLTDSIKNSKEIDLANYYEDITALYTYDEHNYAMPKDIDTIALWYNKAMFDEAGITYPDDSWTWETFRETAKKLTKADGSQFGYALNASNNQAGYYNMIYSYGGYVINEEKTKSGFGDPKTIAAMELLEGMIKDGSMPSLEVISENTEEVLFQSGKVAMATMGSWMIPFARDDEFISKNCDFAVLPKGSESRVSIYNGLGWAADANTKHPETAWSLIEYLSSKEAQTKQAELGVTMSALQRHIRHMGQKRS